MVERFAIRRVTPEATTCQIQRQWYGVVYSVRSVYSCYMYICMVFGPSWCFAARTKGVVWVTSLFTQIHRKSKCKCKRYFVFVKELTSNIIKHRNATGNYLLNIIYSIRWYFYV